MPPGLESTALKHEEYIQNSEVEVVALDAPPHCSSQPPPFKMKGMSYNELTHLGLPSLGAGQRVCITSLDLREGKGAKSCQKGC